MTNLRQAAQQALEALQERYVGALRDRAIEALEAALAEPKQKVWCACGDSIEPDSGAKCGNCVAGDSAEPEQEPVRLQCTACGTVYADGVPPQVPEQEPQTTHWEGCEAVHPECKEKNK